MKKLGNILLETGIITDKDLDRAMLIQREHGGLIGIILIEIGAITEGQLSAALRLQTDIDEDTKSNN